MMELDMTHTMLHGPEWTLSQLSMMRAAIGAPVRQIRKSGSTYRPVGLSRRMPATAKKSI